MKKLIFVAAMACMAMPAFGGNSDVLTEEEKCLAMAIYYESRGESVIGQYAVADVVINRVEDERFPDSICDVISQPNQFHWDPVTPQSSPTWNSAVNIAKSFLEVEPYRGITKGAVFFQRSSRIPPWADERVIKIGNHNFFT